MAGCVLLLVRLAASFVLYSALGMPGQLPASVGLPSIPFLLLHASMWLGPAATLLLALSGIFSGGKWRLGVLCYSVSGPAASRLFSPTKLSPERTSPSLETRCCCLASRAAGSTCPRPPSSRCWLSCCCAERVNRRCTG